MHSDNIWPMKHFSSVFIGNERGPVASGRDAVCRQLAMGPVGFKLGFVTEYDLTKLWSWLFIKNLMPSRKRKRNKKKSSINFNYKFLRLLFCSSFMNSWSFIGLLFLQKLKNTWLRSFRNNCKCLDNLKFQKSFELCSGLKWVRIFWM